MEKLFKVYAIFILVIFAFNILLLEGSVPLCIPDLNHSATYYSSVQPVISTDGKEGSETLSDRLLLRSFISFKEGKYDSAYIYALGSGELFKEQGKIDKQILSDYLQSIILIHRGDYSLANDILKQTFKTAESEQKQELMVKALLLRGYLYSTVGAYDQAQELFKRVESIIVTMNETGLTAELMLQKGEWFCKKGDYNKAITHYQKALTIFREQNHESGQAYVLGLLGQYYQNINRIPEADASYKKMLSISAKTGDHSLIGDSYYYLGQFSVAKSDFDSVEFYLDKAIWHYRKANNLSGLCKSYLSMAAIQKERKEFDKAVAMAKISLEIAREQGYKNELQSGLGFLIDISALTGNWDSFVEAYKANSDFWGDWAKEIAAGESVLIQNDYEKQNIEGQITQLKQELAIQKKYDLVITIIIVLSLLNILAVFLYFRSKRRNWRFLRDIINALNYPLFVIDPDSRKIELQNFAAEKQFPSAATFDEIHEEEKLVANEWLDRIIETHQPIMQEISKYGIGEKVQHYQVYLYPLFDHSGKIVHVVEYWADITVQKRAVERLIRSKEALKQSKEEFENVICSIPDAIYSALINHTGKIIDSYYSPVIEKITGYPPSFFDRDQNTWSQIVHPEDLSKLRIRNARAIIDKEKQARMEYRIIHKNGEVRYIRSSVTLNYLDNGLIRADGVLMDVTEMKKAEIELMKIQKLESIGVLAGGIAHDFNNILTAILGNISLARMIGHTNKKVENRLAEAEKACLRAKDLTQQLLTFSKGGTPVKRATSLAHLLEEATTFLLRGSNVKPQFDITENLWLVEADEGQLSQVINNLVINAKQAMPEGGTLSIRAYNTFHDGRSDLPLARGKYVCFSIKDHGIGIDEKSIQKIFDPYFTTKKSGTGLGLAVTFSIVKKHNGYITAQSKPGEGTTFYVYLPASDKKIPQQKKSPEDIIPIKGRVLLMDDEEVIRDVGSEILQSLGMKVTTAHDGKEAIDLYKVALQKNKRYDLVILDLTVPGGMGGKDTIKHLQEIDEQVKAIVSSGYSNDPIMADYKVHGFDGYVSKPYRLEEMYSAIKKVLSFN
ncbi:MAG: response regulator [Calditrichaeota bacterium]|nr:response regulator [Calditrichota bacterium]